MGSMSLEEVLENLELRARVLRALRDVPPEALISPAELAALTAFAEPTIQHARTRNPKLIPPPLSEFSVLRWRLGDVLQWLRDRPVRGHG